MLFSQTTVPAYHTIKALHSGLCWVLPVYVQFCWLDKVDATNLAIEITMHHSPRQTGCHFSGLLNCFFVVLLFCENLTIQ